MTACGQAGAIVCTRLALHLLPPARGPCLRGPCLRRPSLRGPGSLLLAAALLVCLGGCANQGRAAEEEPAEEAKQGPIPPSFEPVVFPNKQVRKGGLSREKRALPEDESGWKEKWALASRYSAGGFEEQALQILNGALAQSPPEPWAGRMRALKTSMRVRKAEDVLLRVDARGVKDYVPFNTDIDFVIRLRNVSNREIVLLPTVAEGAKASPSALLLEIERRDRDIYATQLTRRWNHTVFILEPGAPPIRIPSGGVHELPVRVPAAALGDAITGIRVVELSGLLRPTRFRLAGERRTVRLPIRAGRVTALPGGYDDLVADPLRGMRMSLETVAPAHLLIACEFVPPNRRVAAVEVLAEALADGHRGLKRAALSGLSLLRDRSVGDRLGPLVYPLMVRLEDTPERADALMEALGILTDARFAPDPRLWKDWWRREATLRTTVTPTDPDRRG